MHLSERMSPAPINEGNNGLHIYIIMGGILYQDDPLLHAYIMEEEVSNPN